MQSQTQHLLIKITEDSIPLPPNTTQPTPIAPDTGFLQTLTNPLTILTAFALLTIISTFVVYKLTKSKTSKIRLATSSSNPRTNSKPNSRLILPSLLGLLMLSTTLILGYTTNQTHADQLTLTLNPSNPQITINKDETQTATTNNELEITNFTGYSYIISAKLNSNQTTLPEGLTISTQNSEDTTTTLTTQPTDIIAGATTNTSHAKPLTATIDQTTIQPGEYTIDIDYTLTENEAPIPPAPAPNPQDAWVKADSTKTDEQALNYQINLDPNMIPITNKADFDATGDTSFASYTNQRWANAVTIKPAKLADYQNAAPGTQIPEEDILGYFTYIPRYQYQVCRPNATDPVENVSATDGNGNSCPSDLRSPYLFNIKFQKPNQKTTFNGTTVGGWATHPAFTFGTTELAGIWVGKFESSNPTTSRATSANNVFIKPNQLGISANNVSSQFQMSLDIATSGTNAHNLSIAQSHMMKNSDWGAVAYLSTSIYGRGTSEVYINNCDDNSNNGSIGGNTVNDHTGWAGTSATAGSQSSCSAYTTSYNNSTQAYNGTTGIHASTTDNIYGIYDMSGGNWEYVLANLSNGTIGRPSSSGLTAGTAPQYFKDIDNKYLDIYPSTIFTDDGINNNFFCTWLTCGGQALHETKIQSPVSSYNQSWGGDYSYFVYSGAPWALRSGASYNGPNTGLFASHRNDGNANDDDGFRVVLALPQN